MRIFGPLMRVRTPARASSDGRGSGAPYGRTTGASTRELLIQAARTLIGRGADSPKDRVDHQIVPYEPSSHFSQWSQPQQQQSHHRRPPQHQQRQPRPPRRRVDNLRSKHRNHRKLPHNKPIFNLFNHQQVPTEKPETEDSTTQSSLLGNVFNFFNPLLSNKPDIILHDSPVIKTLPAPDLTKVNEIFSRSQLISIS